VPLQRVPYSFTIRLPATRDRAFRWATDYRSGDLSLMGFEGRRKVENLTKNLILLTDSFDSDPFGVTPGGRVTKVKLVHLLPERRAWTSTHVVGPTRYSQFLYELVPEGRQSCRLHYTGFQVERAPRTAAGRSIAQRARELRFEDYRAWRRLAADLRRDLA
jgi:hypothetical protein